MLYLNQKLKQSIQTIKYPFWGKLKHRILERKMKQYNTNCKFVYPHSHGQRYGSILQHYNIQNSWNLSRILGTGFSMLDAC